MQRVIFQSMSWPLIPPPGNCMFPVCMWLYVCVCAFIHACVFCMCTLQVWISGCEGTGCTPYCSSTLISVAVLVLAVQWNKSVRHLQNYGDVCLFPSPRCVCVLVCRKVRYTCLTSWICLTAFVFFLLFFECVCVCSCAGHVYIKMIRQWKKTRARLCRRRSHVHALHTSWSTMRCTR